MYILFILLFICNCYGYKYSHNAPTFYCTACDFDLYQRCLLCLSAFMIAIYNYNMSSLSESTLFINISHYHADKHKHPIVKETNLYRNSFEV